MVADERDDGPDAAWLRDARPVERDAVADVMRANVRRGLLGVDAPAPTRGRFTVLERVGAGAMGTVLAAYDPVLDRKVAIKVLRQRGEAARARVLAEARALARLSHPNVVAVHEADEHDDEVYIAMEFVRGVDLRQWLAERDRPWPEVVAVMLGAARGLAAAHTAGVVHCDFKPDNVLVGDDGVRVVDFGLAQRCEDLGADPGGGTLPYMAPEVLAGQAASAASDRFSFGVTLFEALHGVRPFVGDDASQLRDAMERGVPESRPARVVPRWLDDVVGQLLAVTPSKRPPSMDVVVSELGRPRRGRRRAAMAGLAATAVLVTGWVAYQRGSDHDPCDGGQATASQVWNETRTAALRRELESRGVPFASSTADRVVDGLDAYREQWTATHREVCEATRVHGTQSDTTYDLRMHCLERMHGQWAAVLTAIEDGDETTTAKAVQAVRTLPEPRLCDATQATAARYARPTDEGRRAAVRALRPQLDRGWALFGTGRYAEARTLSERVVEQAEAVGFVPTRAEARHLAGAVLGRVGGQPQSEAMLRAAMLDAAEAHDDALEAEVAMALVRTMMFGADPGRVHAAADFVRAALRRAGGDVHRVDGVVGEALRDAGHASAAIAALRRALSTERRPDRIAILQTTLASAQLSLGEHDAALALYDQALASAVEYYGDDHPSVGFFLHRLGRGRREAGQLSGAREILERSLRLREAALGPDDRAVASTLLDLASTELALGEASLAATHLERALAIRQRVYGQEHARVAEVLVVLARTYESMSRPQQARDSYARALALRVALTPEHPQVIAIREHLARLDTRAAVHP
ncbi:MAG: serine/threonine-protein kinase [Deltaproteobacteria bacterium]|nr:serine/threonine-protein kinase [Deltaproteobacteria bacterium]